MKKDKLYTVNKWNQPMFGDKNLFWPGGEMNSYGWTPSQMEPTSSLAYKPLTLPTLQGYESYGPQDLIGTPKSQEPLKLTLSDSTIKDVNAQIQKGMQQPKPTKGLSNGTKMAIGALGSVPTGDRRGMFDTLDPLYYLADGRESKFGNALGDAGVGLFQAGAQSGNGALMFAGAAGKIAGDIFNWGWGVKENKENVAAIKQNTAQAKAAGNALASSTTSSDFFNNSGQMVGNLGFGWKDLYENGRFTSKGTKEGNALINENNQALAMQRQGEVIGANNVDSYLDDGVMSNFKAAFGGPINTENNNSMGALEYGLMSDFLNTKQRQAENKNNMGNLFAGMPGSMFALGGDIQTNGADFTTGMTHVNAGGSHEENPNEGIQMGVDPQGTPNLVEENETVYNDYVYSNRIFADGGTLKKFHLPKKAKLTYADITKKLEKEIKERPNDPISKAAFKAQMEDLANEQERQKQEMEAERAREAFEALSPEEQVEVMQYAQQQEQAQQEAAMQEQAVAEQQAAAQQQPSPEEMAMMQQQVQGQPTMGQPEVMEGQPMMAYGGKVNRFDGGGVLQFLNKLGYRTVAEAEKAGWKPSDFGDYNDWKDINSNSKISDNFKWTEEFSGRLTSPEQKAMLSLGWNPAAALIGRKWYEGDNGNNVGWTASVGKDALNAEEFKAYADRYKNTLGWAVSNGLISAPEENGTVSMADIAKAMSQSPDWKKTDDWLYSDIANQAAYLGMAKGLNDPDDVKFDNKWAPYGTFTQGADGNWNYTLKSDLTDIQKQAFTDLFRKARTDNKVGVMYNNFHDPDTVTNRYVLDEDGNPVLLTGNDLSGYEQLGTYSWGDEANDINNNAILYRAKNATGDSTDATKAGKTEAGKAGEGNAAGDYDVAPVLKDEWPRYAGLAAPIVGLGMQMAGVGKPDKSGLDYYLDLYNKYGAAMADYMPIGDYHRYTPMDVWASLNRMDANARAADRITMNSSLPLTTKYALTMGNNYTNQIAHGETYRQGLEYNDNKSLQAAQFNKDTNKFNAEAYNRAALQNAEAMNRQRQYSAQLGMQAAAQKADMDAGWYNGIYGNVAGLFKGISDLGRENAQHNMIAKMAADGIFGNISDKQFTGQGFLKRVPKYTASEGGKIGKKKGKRGLTI